ncbi:MAG: hypothetical protein HKN63_04590 [Rhodobacteraceae bacterium]|nr:hypothetical protein [Paracoccaceae bacterium]
MARAHVPHDETQGFGAGDAAILSYVRGQLYRSTDFGQTWDKAARGLTCPVPDIPDPRIHQKYAVPVAAISASDGTQYAFFGCYNQLYASTDNAATFSLLGTFPDGPAQRIHVSRNFSSDGTLFLEVENGGLLVSRDFARTWQPLAFDAPVVSVLLEGRTLTVAEQSGRVSVWDDLGATLRGASSANDLLGQINALVPRAESDGTGLLAATSTGLWHLGPNGRQKRLFDKPDIVSAAALARTGGEVLLALHASDGVYRSSDGGTSWALRAQGLETNVQAQHYDFNDFSALSPMADGSVLVAAFTGVFRSTDGGQHWQKSAVTYADILGLQIVPGQGDDYRILAGTYGSGIIVSEDGGESWPYFNDMLNGPRSTAFSATRTEDGTTHLLSGTFGSLNRSRYPAPWTVSRFDDFPRLQGAYLAPTPLSFAFHEDRAAAGETYAFIGMYPHSILATTTGTGAMTTVLETGRPVRSLAISDSFEADGILLAAEDGKILRSGDGGQTWSEVFAAPIGSIKLAIAAPLQDTSVVFAGSDKGLFVSADQGRTWREMDMPAQSKKVLSLGVAPDFAQTGEIFVQTRGEPLWIGQVAPTATIWAQASFPAPGDEIYSLIERERQDLIVFSPRFSDDGVMYGASRLTVMKSIDRGRTWAATAPRDIRYEAEYARTDWFLVPVRPGGDDWKAGPAPGPQSSGRVLFSNVAGATLSIDFAGTGIRLIGLTGPELGAAEIFLDGQRAALIDNFSAEFESQKTLFETRDLQPGQHILTVVVKTEPKDRAGNFFVLDAFDVVR